MTAPTFSRNGTVDPVRYQLLAGDPRWSGVTRPYSSADVERLRSSIRIEHTLADVGARRLWDLLTARDYVAALGALTGSQAVQMVRAGLEAIYVSGWQVAADANLAGQTYPDQSLYPANSVPALVRRLNQALLRADQIERAEGSTPNGRHWLAPLVADAEAGFGGPLNAFELMKGMIEAGAAGVHFEDQLSSEKKCGHLGGKVLVPTGHFIRVLVAARLAADVLGVPTVLIARTDAHSAKLLTSDIDARDREFCTGDRTTEGFYRLRGELDCAIARAIAYAPYADLLWCETSTPDLAEASRRGDDRDIPARARGHGIQVPVRDARRFSRAELRDVRSRPRLPRARHGGVRRAAGSGIRGRGGGVHSNAPPARGRDRILRRRVGDHLRRAELDARVRRVDREGTVLEDCGVTF